jgi:hypothetical protein
MLTAFNLISSILLASGFFFLGFLSVSFLKLEKIINRISNPIYQYSLFGIVFFLLFLYPVFFLGVIKSYIYKYIALIIIFLGIINFLFFYTIIIKYLKKKIIINYFFNKNYIYLLFLLLFFFLSLSPITSGDSLGYHGIASKYILQNGSFPSENFDLGLALVGIGEYLNAFAFSVNAYQFTSFIQFLGLISIFGLFKKIIDKNKIDLQSKQFFYLLLLSCPVLIFLISSSKPQFFYIALIIFCYSTLIHIREFKKKNEVSIIFIISVLFCSVAFAAKLSFSVSFFLIVLNFFFLVRRIFILKKIVIFSIVLSVLLILPNLFWKQEIYNYPFYFFFLNPLPMNIPGYSLFLDLIHLYENEKFPLSLFIPTSLGHLTGFIGVGFFSVYYLIKEKFYNKKIFLFNIFFFIIIISIFGQRSSRFYLEIYLLSILLLILIFEDIKDKLTFKIFKILLYFQSIYVFSILVFGVLSLFPGSLTDKWNKEILSKNASGYNLYNWVNNILPLDSRIITYHRSGYFSDNETFFLDFVNFVDFNIYDQRNYWLLKLKHKKPKFILFYGKESNFSYGSYNFKNCLGELFASQKNVGFHETRNPFNNNREYYNGYIYIFDYEKLPHCVIKNN